MRAGYFARALASTSAVAGCLLTFGAVAAQASSLEKAGSTVRYVDDLGNSSDVHVTRWGDGIAVSDFGSTIAVGPGCHLYNNDSGYWARCDGPVERVELELGDGNDQGGFNAYEGGADGPLGVVFGGTGNDSIHAGFGGGEAYGGPGDDNLSGGSGADLLVDESGMNSFRAEGGDDRLIGGSGVDTMWGGGGSDYLDGGGALDELSGNNDWGGFPGDPADGSDVLLGGPGTDHLDGEGESDTISGGEDGDQVSYDGHRVPVTVTLDGRPGDGAEGENDNLAGDIEHILGGPRADTLVGNDSQNGINGFEGDDLIVGGGDGDRIIGDDGDDRIYGGAGPADAPAAYGLLPDLGDDLRGDLGNDLLVGGAGQDYFTGNEGDDRFDSREPEEGPAVKGELVACGVGRDFAEIDGDDAPDLCEEVQATGRPRTERPAGPFPFPFPPPPGGTPELPGGVTIVLDEPRVSFRRGVLTFRMRCVEKSGRRCRGRASARLGRRTNLASTSFVTASKRTSNVRMRLARRGRTLLRKRGVIRARATVSLAQGGKMKVAWTRNIVLRRRGL